MGEEAARDFRDRFRIPIADEIIAEAPFYRPADDSAEMRYLRERRTHSVAYCPAPYATPNRSTIPDTRSSTDLLAGSANARCRPPWLFVRLLELRWSGQGDRPARGPHRAGRGAHLRDGGLFRQLGIYSAVGQTVRAGRQEKLMYYREDTEGQILEEGINEAGSHVAR